MPENPATASVPSLNPYLKRRQLFFKINLVAGENVANQFRFRLRKHVDQSSAVKQTDGSILRYPLTKVVALSARASIPSTFRFRDCVSLSTNRRNAIPMRLKLSARALLRASHAVWTLHLEPGRHGQATMRENCTISSQDKNGPSQPLHFASRASMYK